MQEHHYYAIRAKALTLALPRFTEIANTDEVEGVFAAATAGGAARELLRRRIEQLVELAGPDLDEQLRTLSGQVAAALQAAAVVGYEVGIAMALRPAAGGRH
jgi:hypothetical protein